jgi:hypothetical protein
VDIKVTNLATFVKIDPPNTQVSAKLNPVQATLFLFLSLSVFVPIPSDNERVLNLIENKRVSTAAEQTHSLNDN